MGGEGGLYPARGMNPVHQHQSKVSDVAALQKELQSTKARAVTRIRTLTQQVETLTRQLAERQAAASSSSSEDGSGFVKVASAEAPGAEAALRERELRLEEREQALDAREAAFLLRQQRQPPPPGDGLATEQPASPASPASLDGTGALLRHCVVDLQAIGTAVQSGGEGAARPLEQSAHVGRSGPPIWHGELLAGLQQIRDIQGECGRSGLGA